MSRVRKPGRDGDSAGSPNGEMGERIWTGGKSAVCERVWPGEWVAEKLDVRLHWEQGEQGLRELLGLALRRNPRRAHLLVSRVLGKHVPQRPGVVLEAGLRLGRQVRELLGEAASQATVFGYAETATGLGHSVADGVGRVSYLHSTRRPVAGVASAGGFEEEHSHATSHLLLPENPGLLAGKGPLVLVDDELSTGRTVRNTVVALHRAWPRRHYVVAALVDVRSAGDRAELERTAAELGVRIDVVALASGAVQLPDDALRRGQELVAAQELPVSGELSASGGERSAGEEPLTTQERPTAQPLRVELGWPGRLPDGGRHGFTPEDRERLETALPGMADRLAGGLVRAGVLHRRSQENAPSSHHVHERRPTVPAPRTASTNPQPPQGPSPASDPAPRVLVLGNEELMYAPLRLASALDERFGGAVDVRFSTTTRSPVLAVDHSGYAIRTRLSFPAHDAPTDESSGQRYAYNIAPGADLERRFDAVIAVVDSAGDTERLHAPDGLLAQIAPHTDRVLLAVVPSYTPTSGGWSGPRPLHGPAFSSYAPEDVSWLLQDLSDTALEAPTEEREEAIQRGGAHYAESLPVEYQPSEEYQGLFHAALEVSAERIARAVGTVTETLLAERATGACDGRTGGGLVLASLARAGTPIGVLMRRWAQYRHGLELPHYAVSIVRGRGIDTSALRYLAAHHDPRDVVFVDGWTGKGAITRELAEALGPFPGFDPDIAVLADPGSCVRTYGTREDFLIPSACLNSTVSGLVSRTVLRGDLVGPEDFHGAKFYRELAETDVSQLFLEAVERHFPTVRAGVSRDVRELLTADRTPTWEGWRAVERVSQEYGIGNVNLVKPGVGETTRVLLRRVPWRVLTRAGAGAELDHVRLLAEQRGVPVEEVGELPYSCVGLIHPRFTRGATGTDGKAAQ